MPDRADKWFEELYAGAGDDFERIPWVHLTPRPALVEWLERHPPAAGTPALVVASGLGDDAEELARLGCAVEAFDLSPTAIAITRRRFPDGAVGYRVADLFELPEHWRERFEIVVEVQTIQSVPPEWHRAAIAAVAACVAPGGRLLVRTAMRPEDEPAESRPWPLAPSELRWFKDEGLHEVSRCVDGVFVNIDFRRSRMAAAHASGASSGAQRPSAAKRRTSASARNRSTRSDRTAGKRQRSSAIRAAGPPAPHPLEGESEPVDGLAHRRAEESHSRSPPAHPRWANPRRAWAGSTVATRG